MAGKSLFVSYASLHMQVNIYCTTNIWLTHKKSKKFNATVSKNNGYYPKYNVFKIFSKDFKLVTQLFGL